MGFYAAGQELTGTDMADIKDAAVAFTLTITGGGAFAVGNGTKAGEQQRCGNHNFVRLQYTFGSTSNQGTGAWTWSGFTASVAGPSVGTSIGIGWWFYVKPASTQRAYGPVLMGPGASTVSLGQNTGALAAFQAVGAAIPEAWATGAIVTADFYYPVL